MVSANEAWVDDARGVSQAGEMKQGRLKETEKAKKNETHPGA
jgi:hypothetical protein